jgi:hypothetical protein
MTFPHIVSTLTGAKSALPVAADFDAAAVKEAIREAQTVAPAYRYKGFISKVAAAGCAGYIWFHSWAAAFFTSREAPKPTSNIFLNSLP